MESQYFGAHEKRTGTLADPPWKFKLPSDNPDAETVKKLFGIKTAGICPQIPAGYVRKQGKYV
jgi:hypothetical protein